MDMKKALEQAIYVNMTLPVCPVTKDSAQKYPQVGLLGKYSIIDTAFSHRTVLIDAACSLQPEEVKRETKELLDAATPLRYQMLQTSSMLHNLELAGILFDLSQTSAYADCKKKLLEHPCLMEYHKAVTSAEHMVGLKTTEISNQLRDFCAETLGQPFPVNTYRMRIPLKAQDLERQLPAPDEREAATCLHYTDPKVLKKAMQNAKQNERQK